MGRTIAMRASLWAAGALAAGLLWTGLSGAEDLYDPDEAARYRREPRNLADRVLESATTQPEGATTQPEGVATRQTARPPASQPDSPFQTSRQARRDALAGYIELSDGTVLPGRIYTTRERPWSVFDAESRSFRRIPPAVVRKIDAEVVWERDEPDWRWKEEGSDEKVHTGRTYPARMLRHIFTLASGQTIAGTVQQPIYVQPDGGGGEAKQFILHERDKGPLDGKLDQLVYVKQVCLGDEALARGKELASARAARSAPTTQPAPDPAPGTGGTGHVR